MVHWQGSFMALGFASIIIIYFIKIKFEIFESEKSKKEVTDASEKVCVLLSESMHDWETNDHSLNVLRYEKTMLWHSSLTLLTLSRLKEADKEKYEKQR